MSADADYAQTMAVWKQLVDVRFRVLALVPTLTAAGVGLLGNVANLGSLRVTLVAVLGLVTVFALRIYDLRNSELHDIAVHRLKKLEKRDLKLERSVRRYDSLPGAANDHKKWPIVLQNSELGGGVFSERPPSQNRYLGMRVQHDAALGIAYTASMAAWVAIGAYSALRRLTDLDPTELAWAVAAIVALTVVIAHVGLLEYNARHGYMKHVLTSGTPTERWGPWDGGKSFWNRRSKTLVEKANKAVGPPPITPNTTQPVDLDQEAGS